MYLISDRKVLQYCQLQQDLWKCKMYKSCFENTHKVEYYFTFNWMGLINFNNILYLISDRKVLQYCQFQWPTKKMYKRYFECTHKLEYYSTFLIEYVL